MIVKGKSVVGLNVVTVDTGTVIETVDDVAYDPTTHRIVALLVDSGGIFSSAKAIHMDDVHNIGENAVIVHDASVVKSIKELSNDVRSISDSNKHLVKTNVLTVDGKELGKVTDIYFDSKTGITESMEVSQGGLKNIAGGKKSIKPSDIVTIGADATIVSAYTESKFEEQAQENGLKGMLNTAKDKAEEVSANAKETIQDATEKTVAASKDVAHDVKDKSIELKNATEDKAEDLRETTIQKSKEWREASAEKSAELREKAAVKVDEVQAIADRKGQEAHIKAVEVKNNARVKADQANERLSEVAYTTQENIRGTSKIIKDKVRDQVDSSRDSSRKVVKKTSQLYEDKDKIVESKRTVVKK